MMSNTRVDRRTVTPRKADYHYSMDHPYIQLMWRMIYDHLKRYHFPPSYGTLSTTLDQGHSTTWRMLRYLKQQGVIDLIPPMYGGNKRHIKLIKLPPNCNPIIIGEHMR